MTASQSPRPSDPFNWRSEPKMVLVDMGQQAVIRADGWHSRLYTPNTNVCSALAVLSRGHNPVVGGLIHLYASARLDGRGERGVIEDVGAAVDNFVFRLKQEAGYVTQFSSVVAGGRFRERPSEGDEEYNARLVSFLVHDALLKKVSAVPVFDKPDLHPFDNEAHDVTVDVGTGGGIKVMEGGGPAEFRRLCILGRFEPGNVHFNMA